MAWMAERPDTAAKKEWKGEIPAAKKEWKGRFLR